MHEFATRQINLWKRFFPNLKKEQLNTLVVSGLTKELALQMSHYVENDKKDFINYCKWTDTWEETGLTDSDFEMHEEPKTDEEGHASDEFQDEGEDQEDTCIERERIESEKQVAAEKEKVAAAAAEKARVAAEKARVVAEKEK